MSLLNVILIILGFIVYSPDVYKSKYKSACNIKTTSIGYTTKYGHVSMNTYTPAAAANDGIYNCYSSHVSIFNSPKIYSPCTPARLEVPLTNSMQRVTGYDSNGNKILEDMDIPEDLEVKQISNTEIEITGIDKVKVGQFASEVRAKRPPEPYKGKGIKYTDEVIRRKEGKKASK